MLTMCLPMVSANGQSTRVQFDVRYGADLEKVALTGTYNDDLELAKRMFDDAKVEGETTAMVTLLCERVYKTGSVFPTGYALAVESMRFMVERMPAKKLSWLSYATAIQQKMFKQAKKEDRKKEGEALIDMILEMANLELDAKQWSGAELYYSEAINTADEISSSRRSMILAQLSKMEAVQYVVDLKERFDRDSSDTKAVEGLMRLYVIELDDPAQAVPYQYATTDADMTKYVELASRDMAQLLGGECLELGDWYMGLSKRATPGGRMLMLARAKTFYDRYLILHSTPDSTRQRVMDAVAELAFASPTTMSPPAAADSPVPDAAVPTFDPTPAMASSSKGFEPEEGWVDLLAPIDLIKHVGRGVWDQKDGNLIAEPPTPAQITTPFAPTGDYIMEVRLTRISVGGSAAVHLPIGEQNVMLLLGERRRKQRDYVAGLDVIDGNPVIDNETATPFELKTAELYTVHVEVFGVGTPDVIISVLVNDEPVLDWAGASSSLGTSTEWTKFAPTALGVGCDGGGTFEFHGARLMMITGEASELP